MYHENPLVLVATNFLLTHGAALVPAVFVLMDLLTGVLLYSMAKRFTREMVSEPKLNQARIAIEILHAHIPSTMTSKSLCVVASTWRTQFQYKRPCWTSWAFRPPLR